MSNASDFVIENGVLTKYKGFGGKVIIPEEVPRDKLYSLVLKRLDDKEFSIK